METTLPRVLGNKVLVFALLLAPFALAASEVVNDVTQLNPIVVDKIIAPASIEEICAAVKSAKGAVSIGGARHSQGGQIATQQSLYLDMRSFDKIVAFDPENKTITVQAGITWRDIQDKIDPYNLSV